MKLGALRDLKITQFSLGPLASIFAPSVGFGSSDPREFVDTSPKSILTEKALEDAIQ